MANAVMILNFLIFFFDCFFFIEKLNSKSFKKNSFSFDSIQAQTQHIHTKLNAQLLHCSERKQSNKRPYSKLENENSMYFPMQNNYSQSSNAGQGEIYMSSNIFNMQVYPL